MGTQFNKRIYQYSKYLVLVSTIGLLPACSSFKGPGYEAAKQDNIIFSAPLRAPKTSQGESDNTLIEQQTETEAKFEVTPAPTLSIEQAASQATETILPILEDEKISRLSFNNMPVGAFINEVFGNQLGLNYVVEPSIKNTSDLVTMRLSETVKKKELYELAAQTLQSYGVTTSLKNNILFFDFSEDAANGEVPYIISGRTLPEVPSSTRPIFWVYPLKAVSTKMVRTWLNQMFPGKDLDIKEDTVRNSIVFNGPQRLVKQALAATELLDRPAMQGMYSRIIRPSLSSVTDLASNLETILKSEGYAVTQGDNGSAAIRLLPLESVSQLIVFSSSQEVLSHIIEWAKTLETERHNSIEQGLFSYQVQSTLAEHIVGVLNSLGVADYQSSANENDSANTNNTTSSARSTANQSRSSNNSNSSIKGRYAVDDQLNTILYSGSGKNWLQVLPVIKQLDKPAPSVMVEVIVAEVSLDDSESTGLDWIVKSSLGKYNLDFSTFDVTGVVSSMFDSTVDTAGGTRALLNVFYSNNKANVRSRPRIMVKSGGEATINVGDSVPVITQTSQSTTDSDAAVIETVSYQDTGVILSIKPTVHASGFVDIEIDQEISLSSGDSLTPTISNRNITTTVSLRDGGSVLLGGLISSTTENTNTGIPVLGKLPLIGKLFSNDSDDQKRTELMIMIIPYVLNSPEEAESLTDELQMQRIQSISADLVPQTKQYN